MKQAILNTVLILAVLAGNAVNAAIMSGEDRSEKLAEANDLLANKVKPVPQELLDKAPNPFSADLGSVLEVEEEVEEVVLTDEELLTKLSTAIQPTGIFMFGGDYYLIFKEKKLKSGSELNIMYRGAEYSITISEITRNAYSITRGEAQLQLKLK